jgi:hypothetical protein
MKVAAHGGGTAERNIIWTYYICLTRTVYFFETETEQLVVNESE